MLQLDNESYAQIDGKLLQIEQSCIRGMNGNTRLAIMDIKCLLHEIREILRDCIVIDGDNAA